MALVDRIKFDAPSDEVLVWKFPKEDLKLGSQLIVNQSQEALFLKGGEVFDFFGPGTHTLASGNLPLLNKSSISRSEAKRPSAQRSGLSTKPSSVTSNGAHRLQSR